MFRSFCLAVLFFFLSQSGFAENSSGVLVSKEKTLGLKDSGKADVSGASKMISVVQQETEEKPAGSTKEPEELPGVEKKTRGIVTGANRQGLAVEYAVDKEDGGFEIWFNYREETKFIGMTSSSEVGEGDTVSVIYNEVPGGLRFVKEVELLEKKQKEAEEVPEIPEAPEMPDAEEA